MHAIKTFLFLPLAAALTAGPVVSSAHATTPAKRAPVEIAPPPADKGQVVFYRTGGMGMALGCQVNEHGERVSALGVGRYFTILAEPGPHSYMVSSEAKDILNLEIEPGETQYVRCKIGMGIIAGRPNISPSTKEEFDRLSHKLKLVDADDQGPKPKK